MARRKKRSTCPARVLVVAGETIGRSIVFALNHGRYTAERAASVGEAKRLIGTWKPHIMIVDIDLRPGSPMDLIGQRVAAAPVPTIVMTARGDLRTKLEAFDRGADDFLTLPFTPEELVARALALMRRTYGEMVPLVPTVTIGELEIDMLDQHVRVGDTRVRLTPVEQSLLYLLASNAGKTLSRTMILDAVWGMDFVPESNLVDRHVGDLRRKLRDPSRKSRFIETVAGKGYRFREHASS